MTDALDSLREAMLPAPLHEQLERLLDMAEPPPNAFEPALDNWLNADHPPRAMLEATQLPALMGWLRLLDSHQPLLLPLQPQMSERDVYSVLLAQLYALGFSNVAAARHPEAQRRLLKRTLATSMLPEPDEDDDEEDDDRPWLLVIIDTHHADNSLRTLMNGTLGAGNRVLACGARRAGSAALHQWLTRADVAQLQRPVALQDTASPPSPIAPSPIAPSPIAPRSIAPRSIAIAPIDIASIQAWLGHPDGMQRAQWQLAGMRHSALRRLSSWLDAGGTAVDDDERTRKALAILLSTAVWELALWSLLQHARQRWRKQPQATHEPLPWRHQALPRPALSSEQAAELHTARKAPKRWRDPLPHDDELERRSHNMTLEQLRRELAEPGDGDLERAEDRQAALLGRLAQLGEHDEALAAAASLNSAWSSVYALASIGAHMPNARQQAERMLADKLQSLHANQQASVCALAAPHLLSWWSWEQLNAKLSAARQDWRCTAAWKIASRPLPGKSEQLRDAAAKVCLAAYRTCHDEDGLYGELRFALDVADRLPPQDALWLLEHTLARSTDNLEQLIDNTGSGDAASLSGVLDALGARDGAAQLRDELGRAIDWLASAAPASA